VSHQLLHRKSIHVLEQDPEELNKLRTAFQISMDIKDNNGYGFIAGYHGAPLWYCWHHQTTQQTPISGPFFLPWHRAYLVHLEIYLNSNAKETTIAIPFWDWSSEKSRSEGIPKAYNEEKMPNGQPNPLKKFHINLPSQNPSQNIVRDTARFPRDPSKLPTHERIQDIIDNDNDFNEFLLDIQDVHDSVHGWFHDPKKAPANDFGDMAVVPVAAYDPIFYAHHCMIDRIWYRWQLQHGPTRGFEHMLDYPLAPFNLSVKNVIDIRDRGYDYAEDIQNVSVSVGIGG
jgi:tyrosinase